MSAVLELPETVKVDRRSKAYQLACWAKWPTEAAWPGSLDLYEAAAYKRLDYATLWRACQPGRDNKARLAHQRFGSTYRISKRALDAFGRVEERGAA